jgi:septum formation protein
MKIILASESVWRKKLLSWTGLEFEIMPSGFDEESVEQKDGRDYVVTLARNKARVIKERIKDEAIIIAADTDVEIVHDGRKEILGKPNDDGDQRRMLDLYRQVPQDVYTGVCVINTKTGKETTKVVMSKVVFRHFSDNELEAYVKTGEGRGKAGGYMILGKADALLDRIEGSMTNVVGLPLLAVEKLLAIEGVKIGVELQKVIKEKTGKYVS